MTGVAVPQVELVNLKTRSIRYLEHGWPTPLSRWHAHEEYELHLIVATCGRAFVGDFIGDFSPGSLYLIGRDLPHNWVTDKGHKAVGIRDKLVQFKASTMRDLSGAFCEFDEVKPLLEQAHFGLLFEDFPLPQARRSLNRIRDGEGAERILAFLSLLLTLSRHPKQRSLSFTAANQFTRNERWERIAQVINFIFEHYAEPLSLEQASSLAGMSRSAFSRNFSKATGHRFVEFVNRVRVGEACNRLRVSDGSVSVIGFEVGFQNLSHFNRQFQRYKAMTPRAYRQLSRPPGAQADERQRGPERRSLAQ